MVNIFFTICTVLVMYYMTLQVTLLICLLVGLLICQSVNLSALSLLFASVAPPHATGAMYTALFLNFLRFLNFGDPIFPLNPQPQYQFLIWTSLNYKELEKTNSTSVTLISTARQIYKRPIFVSTFINTSQLRSIIVK